VRGQPAPVPISGVNAKRVVYGVLNIRTGNRLLWALPRHRAIDFQEFLEVVRWYYRSWHVAMVLDEDSSHTAQASRRLAEQLDMELLWLPKRSPHLNPMDHLWRHGKEIICANRQYETMEDQLEAFLGYLYELAPQQALRKAGVASGHFWLAW
jgi:DDE superfamily endonuclease